MPRQNCLRFLELVINIAFGINNLLQLGHLSEGGTLRNVFMHGCELDERATQAL